MAIDSKLLNQRMCHIDRSGDISDLVFRVPSSLRSVGRAVEGLPEK